VNLQQSEAEVYAAASRIFSAFVNSQQVSPQNEAAMIERSIDIAIKLAQRVDIRVQSAEETDKK
jgi:intergrase/recombinase